MFIYIILWVLGIVSPALICYFTNLYQYWYFDLIFVLFIPLFVLFWFGIYVAILWVCSLFLKNKKVPEVPKKSITWVIRQTSYVVLHIFHARMIKTGPEFPSERCLIIQNHTSNFDPMPFLVLAKNQPLCCVSKPANLKLPVAGPFITQGGFIPIDRDNDFNAVKAIVHAANNIKNDISSIYICPEGTRNHHSENGMLEWKPGALKIAYKAKCPIVVTAVTNADKIIKRFLFHHTKLYIDVLEIIPYEKYKDMNTQELADYCKAMIAKKLEERS